MASATLKGKKDGYEIQLAASASFAENLSDLAALFKQVQTQQALLHEESAKFTIASGERLLDEDQKAAIQALLKPYPGFQIINFSAAVVPQTKVANLLATPHVPVAVGVIRSGQERRFDGDVLFIGAVHYGGVLRATGNIFCLGEVAGIVHAGYPNDAEAIAVGDFTGATQVHIADTMDIVDAHNTKLTAHSFAYVNDLHALDYADDIALKELRPRLYQKLEE